MAAGLVELHLWMSSTTAATSGGYARENMPLHTAKPNLEDVGGKPMTSRQPDEGVTRKRRREAREAASCTRNARVRQGLAGALRLWRTPPY